MIINKVAYICDQKKDCARFENCQRECFHTTDEMHTKNGIVKDVKELNDSKRFRKVGAFNETKYYMEVRKVNYKKYE